MNDYYYSLSDLTDELESYFENDYNYDFLSETGDGGAYYREGRFGGYKFIIANSVSAFLFTVFGIFVGLYFEGENHITAEDQMCHFFTAKIESMMSDTISVITFKFTNTWK